jgi:hypothetical protein
MIEHRLPRDNRVLDWRCALWAILLASNLFAVPASAARIEVERGGETATVTVRGTLESDDGQRFTDAVASVPKAIVMLNSNGGDLDSGLVIGRTIRRKSFTTAVPSGVRCASACALAWLGGTTRFMGNTARVGFHAAYVDGRSGPRESGVGNALVGAYLNGLGLAEKAIIYLTSTPPDDIQWLTMEDARKIGIAVAVLAPTQGPPDSTEPAPRLTRPNRPVEAEPQLRPSRPSQPAEAEPSLRQRDPDIQPAPARWPATNTALKQRAGAFIGEYFDHWSDLDARAKDYIQDLYAESVDFYGKTTPRRTIVDMKQQFIERWPIRVYTLRPESLEVACDQGTTACVITGQVDWETLNVRRGMRSTGLSNFVIAANFSASGSVRVYREGGKVISRSGEQ